MKKLLTTLLIALIALLPVAALAEGETLNVVALKGPTAMGMVQMMDTAPEGWNFDIVADISLVPPMLVKGEADIAAVPANLASVLYNNDGVDVQVLAVNTLGVLYILESGDAPTVTSVEDLKGKTIYASGKGATPEYALNYILKGNGLDPQSDVTVEWKSEHAECLNALINEDNAVAMLPQPFVTTATMKAEKPLTVVLDLTKEWDKLQTDAEAPSAMITGAVVVRREYAEAHHDEVVRFMDAYAQSVAFVNEDNDAAAALVGKFDIVPEPVAKLALPACNIVLIEGDELKAKLGGYLAALCAEDPAAVGGQVPGDDFYFTK